MEFSTPILLIIFNRPSSTKVVLESIRKARPLKLYVAADGPRVNNLEDYERCEATRRVIDSIDWPCKVYKLFRKDNLGCGWGPADAISWFFKHEEYGIIIEDDCVADLSFYRFCQEMLLKYADDTRIMHISGTNHNPNNIRDRDYSYFFSQIGHMWGWATWRRAWALFDFDMSGYNEIYHKKYLTDIFPNYYIRKYLQKKFSETKKGVVKGVWDYQWEFARAINSGLSITPAYNLVRNIGFGDDATHTLSSTNYFSRTEVKTILFPLNHPPFILKDAVADKRHFYKMFRWVLKRKALAFMGFKGYVYNG